MTNIISRGLAHTSSLLKRLQVKRFFAVVLTGFLLLAVNVGPERSSQATNKIDRVVEQSNSQRPKTLGEWNKEARETEGSPGKRLQEIAKESTEALKDWGSVYPDTAKKSTRNLDDTTP